jgi:phenylalanyl-tRNA synthetase beta chain
MKYSYNWLKEISDTKRTPKELSDLLMLHAFEVEGIEEHENKLEGVVVGEILEIEKHPNADKLQVTKVDIGPASTRGDDRSSTRGGKEILQIVCGAKNIAVGDKVPVATVGTVLPGEFKIKEAEIRGVKSFGMLCAEDELGLGTSHEGILQLEKNAEIGTPIAEILGLDDAMVEIDILANRAHDALCHVGMGREIAALEGNEIDYDWDGLKLARKKSKKLTVEIKDKKICSRYIGAVLENVKVCDSPQWMKNRLQLSGIRPINNIVDATNYVMLEIGQPLHAFDFDKIADAKKQIAEIAVRSAKEGEEIVILDGTTKKLSSQDIVIANGKNAVALAGVMGGLETGVTNETKTIVLEAANFAPAIIRRTRMRLGIASDAALRFEKEIDPNIAEKAMTRVVEILEHIAGAKLEGSVDEYLDVKKSWNVKLDLAYVDKLLGMKVLAKESKRILQLLGMKVSGMGSVLAVEIPTYRLDITTQEDLIEEIGRVYGYDKALPVAPLVSMKAAPINEKRAFTRAVRNILVSQNFVEVYNYSFYSQRDAEIIGLGEKNHLELETPMNPSQTLMRMSLAANILKSVNFNLKNFKEIQIFEVGNVYIPRLASTSDDLRESRLAGKEVLPLEKEMLVGALVLEKKISKNEKQDLRAKSSFFEAKAAADKLLSQLGIIDHYYDDCEPKPMDGAGKIWHKTRSAEIKIQGSEKSIGFVGEVSPHVLEKFDIESRVAMFEFDMQVLREVSVEEREFQPIRKHPVVVRDLSMIAEKNVSVDEILAAIQSAGGDLILDVDLFDAIDFTDNTSSLAFHIILGAEERTLMGQEIEDLMTKILEILENDLKVKIRK